MQAQAIAKLRGEMSGTDDPYIQLIGEFMIKHITKNPEHAENVLVEGKTVAKSIDAMAAEAKTKQKNGRAMLTDAEGYAVVLNYFGIEQQAAASDDFDVNLEALLEG